jgi:hypothetical protein
MKNIAVPLGFDPAYLANLPGGRLSQIHLDSQVEHRLRSDSRNQRGKLLAVLAIRMSRNPQEET